MESKKSLSGRSILGLFAVNLLALLLILPQSARAELNVKWTFKLSPPGGSGNYLGLQLMSDGLGGVVVRYQDNDPQTGQTDTWINWINRAGLLVLNHPLPSVNGSIVRAFSKVCYVADLDGEDGQTLLVLYRNGQTGRLLTPAGAYYAFGLPSEPTAVPFTSTHFFSFDYIANEENPDLPPVLRVQKHTVF